MGSGCRGEARYWTEKDTPKGAEDWGSHFFFFFFFFFIYYYYYYYSFDILLGDFSSVWTWVVDVVVGFGGGETRWLVFYHSRSHPS